MNRQAGSSHYHKPRGSWVINRVFGGSLQNPREVTLLDNQIFLEFQVTEPILLSPFTFGNPDHPGFYGISNLSFNFQFASNASRAFRSARWSNNLMPAADAPYTPSKTATIAAITKSTLTMTFLTAHPSLSLSSRNVVPYYELPVYKTVQGFQMPPRNPLVGYQTNPPIERTQHGP